MHDRFEHIELARADEQRQLSGLAEVLLRREQRHARRTLIAFGRKHRRGDREQGAADAVAHRVNFLIRHDARNGVKCRPDSKSQIVIHTEIAVALGRILPRHHEHRVPPGQQKGHQGIFRGQIEDVVLHDPGRNDQYRLGKDRLGRR